MTRVFKLLLPLLLISASVGFILYRGMSSTAEVGAEELGVMTGAEAQYDTKTIPDDIYYTQPVESVLFSHQTHAVDAQLQCNVCHTKIFQMQAYNVESQPDFNMDGLAQGKYCGSCHSSSGVAFASDTQCARCHRGVKGLERAEESGSAQAIQ
jgi:c(7)-type cytochrome triheme protein